MDPKYRHEWKHVLNTGDLLILRQRLRAVMESDPHAIDGKYYIRSLYFDNPDDKALREKIDGVNMREKFRIRLYNCDSSVIHLEKKSKRNGLGTKYSAVLTAEQAQKIVDGDIDWMLPGNVRVTLDYDIRTGLGCTDFLNPDAVTIPAGDAPILIEVKWDEFLPSIIRDLVSIPDRRVGSFSKYAQCRIYG